MGKTSKAKVVKNLRIAESNSSNVPHGKGFLNSTPEVVRGKKAKENKTRKKIEFKNFFIIPL
jgi:hypothetical protein